MANLKNPELIEDIRRIAKVSLEHGYKLTLEEAEHVWITYSENMFAGWMMLPKSDEVLWRVISKEPIYSIEDVMKL